MPPKKRQKGTGKGEERNAGGGPSTSDQSAAALARASERVRSMAADLVCPITAELPVDPVLAEDNRFYERSQIGKWISNADKSGRALHSPWTNQPMGPKLSESPQIRATIENLVESGMVEESLSVNWRRERKKVEREKYKAEMMRKANGGTDADAMYRLGCWYHCGQYGLDEDATACIQWWTKGAKLKHRRCMERLADEYNDKDQMFWVGHAYRWGRFGFPENRKLALEWWSKGAKLNHATCIVHMGLSHLIPEEDIAKDVSQGMFLISQGAAMGSCTGMFLMGSINFLGSFGMPRNLDLAEYWLRRVTSSKKSNKDVSDGDLERAKRMMWALKKSSMNEDDIDGWWIYAWRVPVSRTKK